MYVRALRDENAAVFAGAGLSIPAGMVDWKELMREIAADVGLDVGKEHDLVAVAQFHLNERGGRHRLNQTLVDQFSARAHLTENHELLARLPIRTYWTTNYDTLIEESLRKALRRPDVKITVENLAVTLPHRDAVVYKMHGDVSLPDKAVVTKDDYEAYGATRQMFSTALQGDLVSKTFLFLGFSFNDPNLSYVLSRIRVLLGENRRDHYCLLRRVERRDFDTAKDFEYARARQELQVRDLRRYGIIGLVVDNYSEYTEILRTISRRYRLGQVFVSGSAATYEPWTEASAQQFIRDLGRELVGRAFGVVTGFGVGVGDSLLNGVLDGVASEGTRQLDKFVTLRPFPQGIREPGARRARWTDYRKEIVSHAGVALFLFGNKRGPAGAVVVADGVQEEFDLSLSAGLAVVPIGATGHKAAELHRRVMADFGSYYPKHASLRGPFARLGKNTTPDILLARTLDFLEKLRRKPS